MTLRVPLVVCSLLVMSACGDNIDRREPLGNGCQPLLEGEDCLLPYPSDFFLADDDRTLTGRRLTIEGAAQLLTVAGRNADPNQNVHMDGFSIVPTIVAYLPGRVVADGLTGLLDDPATSLTSASPTLLLESTTGRFIPHYVDVDPDPDPIDQRAIIIHPLLPLEPETRYIVALSHVLSEDGTAAPAASGFEQLRDRAIARKELDALEPHYEEAIFPLLEQAGVERSSLQLAWDFTTGSQQSAIGDMLRVRELTLEWMEQNEPKYIIREVLEGDQVRGGIDRIIRGTMYGPRFVDSGLPGAILSRDPAGQVVQSGSSSFDFTVVVPKSVAESDEPGRLVGYGHGFFGRAIEAESESASNIANAVNGVFFSTDWVGMSTPDTTRVINSLSSQPHMGVLFAERTHQAMSNWLVLSRAMKTVVAQAPELQRPGSELPYYEPSRLEFLGISQGHILGGILVGINPMIDRAILHVGGGGFTHLMFRSSNFGPFLAVIQGVLRARIDEHKYIALTQTRLDAIDPALYARFVRESPLPGAEPVPVLMQAAVSDTAVPNLGTYLHARSIGVPLATPSPVEVFGLEAMPQEGADSALAMFDFGVEQKTVYEEMRPPKKNDVHDQLRRQPEVLFQMDAFLGADGVVVHPCAGACVFALE